MTEKTTQKNDVILTSFSKQKLTLEERLALFDPRKHGGEVMSSQMIGLETYWLFLQLASALHR
jgi:hypothetical protein